MKQAFIFAEFGKIFNWQGSTSDFENLDASSQNAWNVLKPIYFREFANRPQTRQLPSFFTDPPGYGRFSVTLIENIRKDGGLTGDYVFVQLQTRKEQEWHLDVLRQALKTFQPKSSDVVNLQPSTNDRIRIDFIKALDTSFGFNHDEQFLWQFLLETYTEHSWVYDILNKIPNRPFNQAHLTILAPGTIKKMMIDNYNLYTGLLAGGHSGATRLKDYWLSDEKGIAVRPAISDRELTFVEDGEQDINTDQLEGLTNLLVDWFNPLIKKRERSQKIILILSGIDFHHRLKLFQAAQRRIINTVGVITFSLDFITTLADFYIVDTAPPHGYFEKQVLIYENELHNYKNNPRSFYKAFNVIDKGQRGDPNINKLLLQGIGVDDVLMINAVLRDTHKYRSQDLARLLLENIRNLGNEKEIVNTLLNKTLQSEESRLAIFELADKYLPKEHLPSFFHKILENTGVGSERFPQEFFTLYAKLDEEMRGTAQIRTLFLGAVKAMPSQYLSELTSGCRQVIFYDLLKYSRAVPLSFFDMPVKEALFSQLYEELNQAINALRKKNLWEQAFTGELAYHILKNPAVWNEYRINTIVEKLNIDLINFFCEGLKFFLQANEALAFIKSLDLAGRNQLMNDIFNRIAEHLPSVWERLPGDLKEKFREHMLSSHQRSDLHLRWIIKLITLAPDDFLADYPKMIELFSEATLPADANPQEEAALLLLRGAADDNSVYTACKILSIPEKYLAIISAMLDKNLPISKLDIENLIDRLPDSHPSLVKLIRKINFGNYSVLIKNLSVNYALRWLTATSNSLRKYYIDGNFDLLLEQLCQVIARENKLTQHFVFDDPKTFAMNDNLMKSGNKLAEIFRKNLYMADANSVLQEYVEKVNAMAPPVADAGKHWKSVLALINWERSRSFEFMDENALRCILMYAFEEGEYPSLSPIAKRILYREFHTIVKNKKKLSSGLIFALDDYYFQHGIDERDLLPFTGEGRQRDLYFRKVDL